ncbi:uncharacterized protein LOC128553803 [Mercenaria mercenaria]|uniref:uncharacterized protein LOC128553803 n=1 Tax=Mercenaria mercenaria TaxID=6596 RepID=UPI00234F309A|nr:uncharacterized protein LOC128553803 [Mercenaria mercenaria]
MGPVMLQDLCQDLCGMLMRFRTQPIAIVADIEKAFPQIGLQVDQRDATLFVWLKDCDHPTLNEQNIQEYKFCRVPFGVVSSPFLLGATVDFHLKIYNDEVAEKLRNNTYVDNVAGAENASQAMHICTKAKSMFTEVSVKVPGHSWDVKKDTMSLKLQNSL